MVYKEEMNNFPFTTAPQHLKGSVMEWHINSLFPGFFPSVFIIVDLLSVFIVRLEEI